MKTSLNPIKPRSQMQRYSYLRQLGVVIEGVGSLKGRALDEYIDHALHDLDERAKEPRRGVQEE